MNKEIYGNYVKILQEELIPAMGCTKPIALAVDSGIVKKGVENTIHSVNRLASKGMRETDAEIIKIMLDQA